MSNTAEETINQSRRRKRARRSVVRQGFPFTETAYGTVTIANRAILTEHLSDVYNSTWQLVIVFHGSRYEHISDIVSFYTYFIINI